MYEEVSKKTENKARAVLKDALRFELDLFLRHGRCLRLCSSIQPCSREGRRLYGRSSATISISCTRADWLLKNQNTNRFSNV